MGAAGARQKVSSGEPGGDARGDWDAAQAAEAAGVSYSSFSSHRRMARFTPAKLRGNTLAEDLALGWSSAKSKRSGPKDSEDFFGSATRVVVRGARGPGLGFIVCWTCGDSRTWRAGRRRPRAGTRFGRLGCGARARAAGSIALRAPIRG